MATCVELGVVGLVNDAHPSFAELGVDRVPTEGLTDHRERIAFRRYLRRVHGQERLG